MQILKISKNIKDAHVLLKLGHSITTDHISPAGAFSENSPAGQYFEKEEEWRKKIFQIPMVPEGEMMK